MRYFAAGLLLVLFLGGALAAQTAGETLTLEQAVGLALERSLSLQRTALSLDTRRVAAENLWAHIFPAIGAAGGLDYRSQTFPEPRFALSGSAAAEVTLSLRPSLPGSMKAVELAYRSQLLSYESARTQLAVETAQSFYRLIRDRRNLENLQNLRDLAVRHFEQNRTGFNNGIVSQVVFLQSQLRAEEARLSLSRAEAAYTSGLGAFLVSLGLDQYLDVSLRGEIAIERLEVDPERLIAEYLPKRPDLLSRRQEIERLDLLSRTNALDARFPVTLSLSAGLGQAGSGLPGGWDTTMPLSGSLRVSIPLNPWIPGTTANQALRAARTEAETARLNLQEAENQARLTVRTLTEELRTSWAVIEIARLRLEIAERAYSLSEQGYRSGTVDSLSLAESRNSMAQARQDLLSGEYDYLSMILQLSAALNLDWNELRNLP